MDEIRERLPDQLLGRVSEQTLERRVYANEMALVIRDHHQVEREREEPVDVRSRLGERRRSALLLGHVACDRRRADDPTAGVADGRDRQGHVDERPVFATSHRREMVVQPLAADHSIDQALNFVNVPCRHDRCDRLAQHLRFGVPV